MADVAVSVPAATDSAPLADATDDKKVRVITRMILRMHGHGSHVLYVYGLYVCRMRPLRRHRSRRRS